MRKLPRRVEKFGVYTGIIEGNNGYFDLDRYCLTINKQVGDHLMDFACVCFKTSNDRRKLNRILDSFKKRVNYETL